MCVVRQDAVCARTWQSYSICGSPGTGCGSPEADVAHMADGDRSLCSQPKRPRVAPTHVAATATCNDKCSMQHAIACTSNTFGWSAVFVCLLVCIWYGCFRVLVRQRRVWLFCFGLFVCFLYMKSASQSSSEIALRGSCSLGFA